MDQKGWYISWTRYYQWNLYTDSSEVGWKQAYQAVVPVRLSLILKPVNPMTICERSNRLTLLSTNNLI